MTNDCLITKLRKNVENDDFPVLGEINFEALGLATVVDPDKQQTIRIGYILGTRSKIVVKLPGAVNFNSATVDQCTDTEVTINNSTTTNEPYVSFKNAIYSISIKDKYKLRSIISRGESGKPGMFKIDLSVFYKTINLEIINVERWAQVTGNISNLSSCSNLKELRVGVNNNVKGDIKDISNLINLTVVRVHWTKVSGDIVQFVQGQRSAGRTTLMTAMTFVADNSSVVFNGGLLPSASELSWTENTITFGDTTINA